MRRVFVLYSQPIRFAGFDGISVNRGLPVLDQARALDTCHRPEGSWALGTRMENNCKNKGKCQRVRVAQEKRFVEKDNQAQLFLDLCNLSELNLMSRLKRDWQPKDRCGPTIEIL